MTKASAFFRRNSCGVSPEARIRSNAGRSASSPTRDSEALEGDRPIDPIAELGLEWRGDEKGEAARLLDREWGVPLRELCRERDRLKARV